MPDPDRPLRALQRLARARSVPEDLGVLNFDRPARQVSEAVLRFSPLARNDAAPLAKIWSGKRLLSVDECALSAEAFGFPGTVIGTAADAMLIACEEGGVWLSGFATMEGVAVPANDVLAECRGSLRSPPVPKELVTEVCRFEAHWRNTLIKGVPAAHPGLVVQPNAEETHAISLDTEMTPEALGAAWLAWISVMTGVETLALALSFEAPYPALSNLRPIHVRVDGTPAGLGARLVEEIEMAFRRPAMSADLLARMSYTKRSDTARDILSVVLCFGDHIPETFSVAILPAERSILLRCVRLDEGGLREIEDRFNAFLSAFVDTPEAPLDAVAPGAA